LCYLTTNAFYFIFSDLPEWSTVGVDIASFGTFDASGAFMSKDVRQPFPC